jgi:hypothetical protein
LGISPSSDSESLSPLLPKAKKESGVAFVLGGGAVLCSFVGGGLSLFLDCCDPLGVLDLAFFVVLFGCLGRFAGLMN